MADENFEVKLLLTAENRLQSVVGGATRDLGRIDDAIDEVDRSNAQLQRSFGQMGTVLQGALAGVSLGAAVSFTTEMYELGSEVNRTSAVFAELGGNIDVMRASTRGAIDDLTLMGAANRLLLTGMAANSEEAARFTNIAITLGASLGQGATESIENFSAAMLNMSYERLDTLGISAATVRMRVQELTAAGMETQEAFKTAVFEEAGVAIERLGASVEGSVTAVDRLQVRWQNLEQSIASSIQTTLVEAANSIEMLFTIGQSFVQMTQEQAHIREVIAQAGFSLSPASNIQQGLTYEDPRNFLAPADRQVVDLMLENEEIAARFAERQREITRELQAQADAEREAQVATEARSRAAAENRGLLAEALYQYEIIANPGLRAMMEGSSTALYRQPDQRGTLDGVTLFNEEDLRQAEWFRDILIGLREPFEELINAGAIRNTMADVLEGNITKAETFVNTVREGVDALNSLTLTQSLGETSATGMFGEISGQVLGLLQGDLEGAEYQSLEDAIGLASGRLTEASLTMRDDVLPMLTEIYNTYGSDALIAAIRNLEGALREGRRSDLTPEELATTLDTATGYVRFGGSRGGGQQIVVNPGDGVWGLARRYDMSEAEVMRILGISDRNEIFHPGVYGGGAGGAGGAVMPMAAFDDPSGLWGIGGGMAGGMITQTADEAERARLAIETWDEPLNTALGKAQEIETVLQGINTTQWAAEIELKVKDPSNILGILTGTAPLPPGVSATTIVRDAVRSSGGRVPGSDGRVRPER